MILLRALILVGALVWQTAPVQALTCSALVSSVNFGLVSVRAGVNNTTSGTLQVSCSGALVATVGTCVTFGPGGGGASGGNSPRLMRRADGATLAYELRSGGNGPAFGTLGSVFLLVPIVLGSGSVTLPIYGDITSNTVGIGTGSYESVFSGAGNIRLNYNTGSCAGAGTGVSVPDFKVSAEVVPSCEIDVGGLDFGQIGSAVLAPVTGKATLQVRCTANTAFHIGLSMGTGGGVTGPTARKMRNGLRTLTYGLYQDAGHSQPWGDTLATSRAGTGLGGNQAVDVFGLIPGGQSGFVGTYSDQVVVTVTY